VAVGVQTDATGTSSFAGGAFAQATGTSSVALGGGGFGSGTSGAVASGAQSMALGASSSAAFSNSTAIGFGATTTRAGQMAFGTATNTYTMSGITSGASLGAQSGSTQFVTTDAFGNLAASNFGPATISSLSNAIHDTRHEARAGVALAMATGNIRYDDRPGKFSVGVGGGGFVDEFGGALGVGYTSPSERVRVNLSGGGTSRGDVGVGAGLGFTLN
jgi:autotransporter adhesin